MITTNVVARPEHPHPGCAQLAADSPPEFFVGDVPCSARASELCRLLACGFAMIKLAGVLPTLIDPTKRIVQMTAPSWSLPPGSARRGRRDSCR